MLQHQRNKAAGLNTARYVSGYCGSPLGGLDQTLHDARSSLEVHNVRFQPGVNEDLAATAILGTQQLHLFPEPKVDGIFAMWSPVPAPPGFLHLWPPQNPPIPTAKRSLA